jgi:hypothetical protein
MTLPKAHAGTVAVPPRTTTSPFQWPYEGFKVRSARNSQLVGPLNFAIDHLRLILSRSWRTQYRQHHQARLQK